MRRRLLVPICAVLIGTACSGGGDGGSGSSPPTTSADPLVVATDLGTVRGTDSAVANVRSFLAVPFAAPPTGPNRWRDPQPREPYAGVQDATRPAGSCPQNVGGSTARFTIIPDPVEDCLTVNVWAPRGAEKLPVMFWIYGGGLRAGSAGQPYYIGDQIASKGVVVVSVNYRLGAFGFLAAEELAKESGNGAVGNYGLADQTAGLDWVRRNVAAFGGDPGNVTIFGESAGGGSVCAHLGSPKSKGLFHKAIIQSGGGCERLQTREQAYAAGTALFEKTGCTDVACLRSTPTEKIIETGETGAFVNDGVRLPGTGRDAAARGDLSGIPVITGSNAEEAFLFTISDPEPSEEQLVERISTLTDDPAALLALYPADRYPSNLARYREAFTDAAFTCPTMAFAAGARNDVFVYHYPYRSTDDRFKNIGPTHGTELVFVFGHPEGITNNRPGLEGRDAEMATAFQTAWTTFAKTGTPGPDSQWRRFQDGGKVTLMDVPVTLADTIREGRCDTVTTLTARRRTLL